MRKSRKLKLTKKQKIRKNKTRKLRRIKKIRGGALRGDLYHKVFSKEVQSFLDNEGKDIDDSDLARFLTGNQTNFEIVSKKVNLAASIKEWLKKHPKIVNKDPVNPYNWKAQTTYPIAVTPEIKPNPRILPAISDPGTILNKNQSVNTSNETICSRTCEKDKIVRKKLYELGKGPTECNGWFTGSKTIQVPCPNSPAA